MTEIRPFVTYSATGYWYSDTSLYKRLKMVHWIYLDQKCTWM